MNETFSEPVVISAICGLIFSVMLLVFLIPNSVWRFAFHLLFVCVAAFVALWSAIIILQAFS